MNEDGERVPTVKMMVAPGVRLVRPLGEGGMGYLWVAFHERLDTEVAVKFIAPELVARQPSLAARFRREASAAAKIASPHVVKILDHGQMNDGTPFIIMELLEGETLAERLARGSTLSLGETVTLVVQVTKALGRAHALEIVHRDLKPDNLFLVAAPEGGEDDEHEDLFVKILDFGIAKQALNPTTSVLTAVGAVVGTPQYMSPEQILSAREVDARADLWALAAVVYEALTGSPPFDGETVGAVWAAITAAKFEPPSARMGCELPDLDAWFARALAREQQDRFQTAREMRRAFAAAARGEDRPSVSGEIPAGAPALRASAAWRQAWSARTADLPAADTPPGQGAIKSWRPARTTPLFDLPPEANASAGTSSCREDEPEPSADQDGRDDAPEASVTAQPGRTLGGASATLDSTRPPMRGMAPAKWVAVIGVAVLALTIVVVLARPGERRSETQATVPFASETMAETGADSLGTATAVSASATATALAAGSSSASALPAVPPPGSAAEPSSGPAAQTPSPAAARGTEPSRPAKSDSKRYDRDNPYQ
jgi:serine/threonine-protein kinase